jgi:hypothetical protein
VVYFGAILKAVHNVCAMPSKAVNNYLNIISISVVTLLSMTSTDSKLDLFKDIRIFRNMK